MSYSFSVGPLDKGDAGPELDAAGNRAIDGIDQAAQSPSREHVAAVVALLPGLLAIVGLPDDDVHVTVAGHANPGHSPREGWADETITITISVG